MDHGKLKKLLLILPVHNYKTLHAYIVENKILTIHCFMKK